MTRSPFLRRLRRGRPIVVVSGLPRSGTSMAMNMLAAGGLQVLTDDVRGADGSNPNGYYELEQVKTLSAGTDSRWLAGARGKALKIISFLLTYLPESYDYQVLLMRRDLGEIVASQNAMLDSRGQAHGAEDDRMRALYEEHLAQVMRFLARRDCFSTLPVDYAEVVGDPRQQASRINAFLGAHLDVDRMAAVASPALYRNRRPPRRSIT
ncbi:MAG: sulfotransferase family protein [Acidobacteria bacterium]|nr:sulfotransferase family protein [Acidobacteriota bacterium]